MDKIEQLNLTFMALCDPTRRAILSKLTRGPCSVAELTRPFRMSQPAVSKHLRILEKAGLVRRGREGQRRPRRLDARALRQANAWLERYRLHWVARLDKLGEVLEEGKEG